MNTTMVGYIKVNYHFKKSGVMMKTMKILKSAILVIAFAFTSCGTAITHKDNNITSTIATSSTADTDSTISTTTLPSNDSQKETKLTESLPKSEKTTIENKTTEISSQVTSENNNESLQTPIKNNAKIEKRIDEIFYPSTENGGKYAVKVISIDDSINIETNNCDTKLISASLIKLYVAGAVYEHIDSIKSYETYSGETEHLLRIMISQSDNSACNTLVTRLGNGDSASGMNSVNQYCKEHGFTNTEMNRLMLDFNGLENYTTPYDCCKILKAYYSNELAGSENVINYMKEQITRTKIPAGITDGTIVANKSGELSSVENDAAIIYADFGTYIMCAMTNDVYDTSSARNSIAMSASYIFDYLKNR